MNFLRDLITSATIGTTTCIAINSVIYTAVIVVSVMVFMIIKSHEGTDQS